MNDATCCSHRLHGLGDDSQSFQYVNLSQMTKFRLFQTDRVCRGQFQIC